MYQRASGVSTDSRRSRCPLTRFSGVSEKRVNRLNFKSHGVSAARFMLFA